MTLLLIIILASLATTSISDLPANKDSINQFHSDENNNLYNTVDKSRGYNSDINWLNNLEDAVKQATNTKKKICLLIHKSWCNACKALKPSVATDLELKALSENFIMVNLQDDEEPTDQTYKPDGGYIPRILFLDDFGKPLLNIFNEDGNEKYKYFYHTSSQIVSSMKNVLKLQIKDTSKNLGDL